jgi:hypothetical protein
MSDFERGILYIATGPSFLIEAVGSAQSVRAAWPDISLALIADAAPPRPVGSIMSKSWRPNAIHATSPAS